MNAYLLSARLLSPLMIQENRRSNGSRCLSYLPGSTLRGAVAAAYLRRGGNADDPAFRCLFLEQAVAFPDLFPAVDPEQPIMMLPTTACSCKRKPGFKSSDKTTHGVRDALAALVAADLEQRPLTGQFTCPHCQQDMKPFRGFWNGNPIAPAVSDVSLLTHYHTGIDRHTGTVAPGIFYATVGIGETRRDSDLAFRPQFLTGSVLLSDQQRKVLAEILTDSIFAGADRTRGMGELQLSIVTQTRAEPDLKAWDKKFRQKIGKMSTKNLPAGLFFSIGLNSHTILVDRFLRPTADLALGFPGINSETRSVKQHSLAGWQSAWRLPKIDDEAVSMGSVYVFRYTGDDVIGLQDYLAAVTTSGIGLRRSEGFGRVRVCDPFHIQEEM